MLNSVRALMLTAAAAATAAFAIPAAAQAKAVGPYARLCTAGKPAVLVRVTGLKAPRGSVAVKLYRSNAQFLEKGAYIRKVEVPVSHRGPIDVCVPVPASGRYALAVRHEVGDEKSRSDGGGFSGNPKLSLMDALLKRKPNLNEVSFQVSGSTRVVPVVLNYLQGGSIRPIA